MKTLIFTLLAVFAGSSLAISGPFNAADPAASGYVKIFDDDFTSLSTIDTTGSGAPGFKWYTTRFFGYPKTPASDLALVSGTGPGLVITSSEAGANYQIATAGPADTTPNGFVGTVFGGGAYFEAKIKFDDRLVRDPTKGWPSFWSLAIEHMVGKKRDQWPGQLPGYEHFIENDFFEYLNTVYKHGDVGSYAAALHDWYGFYNVTCPGFCGIQNSNPFVETPMGKQTKWTDFHVIGQLWVPADPLRGTEGMVQNYFDGVPTSSTSWKSTGYGPPPLSNASPALFSIIDDEHLNIILGSGFNEPLTVGYVRVWSPPAKH